MKFFRQLFIHRDDRFRSAALNMAIDEALLEIVSEPTLRFYRWNHPALSFGYFGKFADVEECSNERDIVRRWTGGGIVFHGEDLTYSIIIPASAALLGESPMSIYESVHSALRAALTINGQKVELAPRASAKVSESCFANPVRADVLLNGQKIAGAAQRRTFLGLLQQGSIQNVDLAPDFERNFAATLSDHCGEKMLNDRILDRAQEIADEKYGTLAWLMRR